VFNYTFEWYDGSTVKGSSDFTGVDYQNLDVGPYTVTATDDVTGCLSDPALVNVADKRVIPQFDIASTPSYCADTGKPQGAGSLTLELTTPDIVLDNAQWTEILTGAAAGTGPAVYNLFPGEYSVVVTTTEGCTNDGASEVKTEIAPYNGISQNGDGQNDFFIIDCITNFPNNNVKIFNRTGILVYEVDGYNNGTQSFKGIGEKGLYMAGVNLPSGTYFYIIDKRDGSKPLAGYLELDR
jgi:gliding motility-associated-like protein